MSGNTEHAVGRRRSSRLQERIPMRQPRPEATLLGIPTEIRLYIYAYLCPDDRTNHHTSCCACHKAIRDDCELSVSQQGIQPRGYLALLLSCRTIYNEAVETLYKPITGTGCEDAKVSHLMISADQITLVGFPEMFCRTHLTYRNGTAGLFQRIKKLHIIITCCFEHLAGCYCCGEWSPGHLGCPPPFGLDSKSQAIDNIRWLAEQLSRPGGFDQLAIKLQWDFDDSDSMTDSVPELPDASALFSPFKALRNVKELKIRGLGTLIEDAMEMGDIEGEMIDEWEEVIAYKKTMREILGSSAPVNENPIPLSTWLGFKQTARRIIFFAPQVGAQKYLEQAAEAVRIQDKNAFQKASNSLLKGWKGELRQRKKIASQIDELRQATYLDIPPGKRKEDGPEGVELSDFTWSDPTIDKEDRAAYISFLENISE